MFAGGSHFIIIGTLFKGDSLACHSIYHFFHSCFPGFIWDFGQKGFYFCVIEKGLQKTGYGNYLKHVITANHVAVLKTLPFTVVKQLSQYMSVKEG